MVEEAFFCPFCGAPYRKLIPAGVVQVQCHYCGATLLVPPRLGGEIRRCPNHPDVSAIGLCNDCGKSYCDRCLYILKVRDVNLHLCSQCYENRNKMKYPGAIISLVLSIMLFMLFAVATANPRPSSAGPPLPILFSAFALFASFIVLLSDAKKKPLSIHDAPIRASPFLKKCIKCNEEIPIASEECQHCGAKQPEYVEP